MKPSESDQRGSGIAIAVGALLDGIPESIVIGTSLLAGKGVSRVAGAGFLCAFALSKSESDADSACVVNGKRQPATVQGTSLRSGSDSHSPLEHRGGLHRIAVSSHGSTHVAH